MKKIISNKFTFASQVTSYTRRGRHRPPLSLTPGDKIQGYELTRLKYFKDFDLTHLQFINKDNQSKIHQFQCSQQSNTLSMVFKTNQFSKPGMNYALQKLLQCGSKKYPVRNISAQMCRRSFSQLGVPQTTDDYLMFSFNTPILRDFSNLFNVYSSMVFDPLMREEDFYEVVRRFTYQDKALGFTGELAAQLHQNQFGIDQTLYSLISQELLGQKAQSLCKPLDLLKISYGELMKYYKQTITIANCAFILHGDMNIHYFIDQCTRNVAQFKPNTHSPIFFQSSPVFKSEKKTINFEHLRQETILMLSYRIQNATEQQITLLQILSYLMFDMPESPFLKFNSPETPYPNLYGFHQRYFNVGITFLQPKYEEQSHMESAVTFKKRERAFIQKQAELLATLREIVESKFSNKMIEKCLIHLENNYYEKRGVKIIESLVDKILNEKAIDGAFQVTPLITKLLKSYRKNNVFQSLLQKFLIDNPNYVVLRGFNNPDIIEQENGRNQALLLQMQRSLPESKLTEIANYYSPNLLQNIALLPEISPHELEFFQDTPGEEIKIGDVKTIYSMRHFGNKFTLKFDLTDVGEEDIPLLAVFCKAFPEMGSRAVTDKAYSALLETYISKLNMDYQCVKSSNGELKIQVYLTIEFTNRNYEFAFNILSGLLLDFNTNNLTGLSRVIHHSASQCFNALTEDILHFHGLHVAASKSPYAFFESPLFQARTICGLAAEMKKVHNPKGFLMGLGMKMNQIWTKMVGWSRMQLLWQCHPQKKEFYRKHLNILLSQIKTEGVPPAGIDISGFPKQKWQKYYPNYQNELVFEAFAIPYRQANSPEALVLSSLINENIATFNHVGGCFLHKGALVSFLAGSRTKFIELQDYYKRIENIDVAKRRIFQRFDRYTVEHQFKKGIGFAQARTFKQAVLSVQKPQIEKLLEEYILKEIKAGNSSILCLGGRLQNYEPLLKKGWQIERSIEDLSLGMQSLSKQQIKFDLSRYVDIS